MTPPVLRDLRVLIVDDEPLARSRLRVLLSDCTAPAVASIEEAQNSAEALDRLASAAYDLVLLDIHMPGIDGMALAERIAQHPTPPAIVFVTAHAEHALQAFDLAAVDYLTKPVRLERLVVALQKAERTIQSRNAISSVLNVPNFVIQDRGRSERVPVADVLYCKAELKYLTVRTRQKTYILDGSLNDLETQHAAYFVRIHRNALVARHALRTLEKQASPNPDDDGESWVVGLHGVPEVLVVSRRHAAAVRAVLKLP